MIYLFVMIVNKFDLLKLVLLFMSIFVNFCWRRPNSLPTLILILWTPRSLYFVVVAKNCHQLSDLMDHNV